MRTLSRHSVPPRGEFIVYWMQTAFRAHGNAALTTAIEWGNELALPVVVYCQPWLRGPLATVRRGTFQLEAMIELQDRLKKRGLRSVAYVPSKEDTAPSQIQRLLPRAAGLVVDDHPFSPFRTATLKIVERVQIPVRSVDACHLFPRALLAGVSDEDRRFKIEELAEELVRKPPETELERPSLGVLIHFREPEWEGTSLDEVVAALDLDPAAPPSSITRGGLTQARRRLSTFIDSRLSAYPKWVADPSEEGTSGLGPYLANGQIDPLEVLLSVRDAEAPAEAKEAFIERYVVLRTLAFAAADAASGQGLAKLPEDARGALDSLDGKNEQTPSLPLETVETADTGDGLFDACQRELAVTGGIHSAVRAYWERKVIETAPSATEGASRLFLLQQRYSLDGGGAYAYARVVAACRTAATRDPLDVPASSLEAYETRCAALWAEHHEHLAAGRELRPPWLVRKASGVRIRRPRPDETGGTSG